MVAQLHPESGKPVMQADGTALGVYTQGKVGSKSLVEAMEGMFPDTHIWDVRRGLMAGVIEHETIRGNRPRLLSEDRQFAEFLEAHPDANLKVASIVREPVAIAVSSLFYNLIPRNPGVNIDSVTDEDIVERLVRGESFSSPSFHLDWFDIEVEPLTGIRAYETAFPKDIGYRTYHGERDNRSTDLLVMRLEDIADVAQPALAGFFGVEAPAALPRNNTGDAAVYADRYRRFRQTAQLPADWVQWQMDSQFATHFYTPDELSDFTHRWTGQQD